MNTLLFAAGLVSILVGLIHSALGEFLIFNKLRAGKLVPVLAKAPLQERHVRILWATWHIASIFGWAVGGILIKLATIDSAVSIVIADYISIAMLASGLLVLIATKGKHPGWIGLCTVAILCHFAR